MKTDTAPTAIPAAPAAPTRRTTPPYFWTTAATNAVLLIAGAGLRLGIALNPDPATVNPAAERFAAPAVHYGTIGLILTGALWLGWRVTSRR